MKRQPGAKATGPRHAKRRQMLYASREKIVSIPGLSATITKKEQEYFKNQEIGSNPISPLTIAYSRSRTRFYSASNGADPPPPLLLLPRVPPLPLFPCLLHRGRSNYAAPAFAENFSARKEFTSPQLCCDPAQSTTSHQGKLQGKTNLHRLGEHCGRYGANGYAYDFQNSCCSVSLEFSRGGMRGRRGKGRHHSPPAAAAAAAAKRGRISDWQRGLAHARAQRGAWLPRNGIRRWIRFASLRHCVRTPVRNLELPSTGPAELVGKRFT